MTPSEVQELKLAIAELTQQLKSLTQSVDRMHKNQDKLFNRLDATEKQLSTLQGEHNIRKGDCGTGSQSSGTWASVVRAVARSKVVSVSLAVTVVAALGIIILLKTWGVIG